MSKRVDGSYQAKAQKDLTIAIRDSYSKGDPISSIYSYYLVVGLSEELYKRFHGKVEVLPMAPTI